MQLNGKTALVTGGAVRIGRVLCEALAARGCRLVVHYRHSRSEALALVRQLRRAGGEAWAVRADLDGQTACERLVDQAVAAAGRLDILVNNAAEFAKADLRALTQAGLCRQWRSNLLAPIFLTRAFARRGHGHAPRRVLNLLDRRIAANDTACLAYVLAKKSLAEFTKLAALALAPSVAVNGVA